MNAKAMKLFGALAGTADVRRRSASPRDTTSNRELASAKSTTVDLDRGDCLTALLGCRVTCECGEAWVTQEGDIDDYLLIPGTSRSIPARGRSVIQALSRCRLAITT